MSKLNLSGGGDPGNQQNAPPSLDDLMKKTAEIMGRIIKKPPLNPKLLSKPPFRYLHDMFSEVIRTTGFAGGLYDDSEMNSENVKDKDAKVAYLTKMIDCVGISTGVEVRANPLKIVAGMDPEETNLFIQLIGKAILKKIDTTEAVRRVLAGEHQGKRRPPPSAKPAHPQSARPQNASAAPPRAEAPSRVPQPQTNHPSQAEPPAPTQQQQPSAQQAQQQQQQQRQQAPVQQKDETQTLQQQQQQQQQQNAQRPPIPQPSQQPQPQQKVQQQQQQSSVQPQKRLEQSQSQSVTDLSATENQGGSDEPDEHVSKQSEVDAEERQLRPVAQVKRRERPASARPAPPKQRAPEVAVQESGPSPVIIQEGAKKVDDDEEYVIIPTEDTAADLEVANEPDATLDPDAQHGGLVRKILETKKELAGETGENVKKAAVQIVSDKASEKKEIVALRQLIQSLCRSTNPLGKMIHYVQEDVDSMNRELEIWKAEAEKYKESLSDEEAITQGTLQPMEEKLKQVERDVEEQLENIRNTKTYILQNDATIRSLLSSLTTPRR